MAEGIFSFLESDNKWFNGTAIATYLIIAGTLISLYFTAVMAYEALNPETVDGKASIEGEVVIKGTEVPLEGVKVSIEDSEKFTFTDRNGDYWINETGAGIQTVVFTKPGYQTVRSKQFLEKGIAKDLKSLGMGVMDKNTKIEPQTSGTVSGTVEFSGAPVEDAEVRINGSSLDFTQEQKEGFLARYTPVSTGPDGGFEIQSLPKGIVELVVVVEFNDTFAQKHKNVKFYQEIVTFYASPGNTTFIDIAVQPDDWKLTDQFHPYTYVHRRSVIKNYTLSLDITTPADVKDEFIEVSVFKHHTGEQVDRLRSVNRTVEFDLEQGLYDIEVLCLDCQITRIVNFSLAGDSYGEYTVPYGMEPVFDDDSDTSGLLLCLIPSVVLIGLGLMGAFYTFTRKKFFLALLGAIALIPQQSIMLAVPALSCVSVNMILGILAALLIFKSRPFFLDTPRPDPTMLEEVEKDEQKEKAATEKPRKK